MVYDLYEMNGPRTPEQCHDIFVKNVEYVYFDIKAMQSEIANEVSRSRSFFFFFFVHMCMYILSFRLSLVITEVSETAQPVVEVVVVMVSEEEEE